MYIKLDKNNGKLYEQLYKEIAAEITSGTIRNGFVLPSRREMANTAGVSQNTVTSAYRMLADCGYSRAIPRQGYVVDYTVEPFGGEMKWERDAVEDIVFSPNGIDTLAVNRGVYAKLLRDVAYNSDIFSYVDKGGEFVLRSAISKYLISFRNIKAPPDRIVMGAGAEYLLLSLASVFGDYSFISENPCDPHYFRTLSVYGKNVFVLPYNTGSFNPSVLNDKDGILLIEPCARFPRSCAMCEEERRAVLEWAYASEKRYIVEIGVDSELVWSDGTPLFTEDTHGKVIYLGSFSRSFSPGIKTSYMVLPETVRDMWKRKHIYYYSLISKQEQYALAEFIDKGHFRKHCMAMRRIYRDKKIQLKISMDNALDGRFRVINEDGSTYITAEICDLSTAAVKGLARRSGIKLFSLSGFNMLGDEELKTDDSIVIGFGDVTVRDIKRGAQILARAIAKLTERNHEKKK